MHVVSIQLLYTALHTGRRRIGKTQRRHSVRQKKVTPISTHLTTVEYILRLIAAEPNFPKSTNCLWV